MSLRSPNLRAGAWLAAVLLLATTLASPAAPAMASDAASRTAAAATKPLITRNLADATISRYGTRTSMKFSIAATGKHLRFTWQRKSPGGHDWHTVKSGTSKSYRARATAWSSGTRFRVKVSGSGGTVNSKTAVLTVLRPSASPAKDAQKKFGLTGLRQGVDLSAYQYTPDAKVNYAKVAAWVDSSGFTILRNGSGARPVKASYVELCTNHARKVGSHPVTEDCAYSRLADRVSSSGRALGHYWFNGWIDSIDPTSKNLFAAGYTPQASAKQYVTWLLADGNYRKSDTDPLVLDVEKGRAWTVSSGKKKYTASLRAWTPAEAADFLATVASTLKAKGYHANLYVYMSANATLAKASDGSYAWAPVTSLARLWVASWGENNGQIPSAQPNTGPWPTWSLWQYTSNARIAGSGVGAIDADIATADAWKALR